MRALLSLGLLLLILAKDAALEIRERNHDHRHIIQRPSDQRILDDILHSQPALLMDIRCFAVSHAIPHTLDRLFIRELIEDPVAYDLS